MCVCVCVCVCVHVYLYIISGQPDSACMREAGWAAHSEREGVIVSD